MIWKRNICCLLFAFALFANGQNKKSKGDAYFFSYEYKDAITAYEDNIAEGEPLSPTQYLNLADSYFEVENYEKANDIYLKLSANDSIMGNYHYNRLLQGLSKTSNTQKIDSVLQNKKMNLNSELQENAAFNKDLLSSNTNGVELDFKVFNLESNSPQSDFSPSFYGTNLLFTSGRPTEKRENYGPSGEAYLDIFEGKVGDNGEVSGVLKFKDIQSSDYHKATPYFSEELNSVFYVLSNTFEGDLEFDEKGKNALGIGMQKIGGDFKFLWRDLSTSFYYPFYDHNSGRLYFAANLKDSHGGTDLYYVNTNKGQIMSAPINLGSTVNTPGNEIAPYVFEGTLYFSSDVFYGLGGMDIFKSNIQDDFNFSIPVNLGKEINSPKDDFGFIIRNEGEGLLGYFSSNREGGKGGDDIYGFLVDEKPGIKTLAISGQVLRNGKNSGVESARVSLLTPDGELLKEVTTDEDGNYRIEIPWQEEIILEATKERFSLFSQKYISDALAYLESNPANIALTAYEDIVEKKEKQTVFKLRKFYFENGRSTVTPEIAIELDKVVEAVKQFPEVQLRIESHTDSRGGGASNFRLTQRRSDAIKKYLVDNGVPNTNILYSVGYGEDKILNNCKNGVYCLEMLHKQNQRSLIVVLNDNVLF